MKLFSIKALLPLVAAAVLSTAAHASTLTFEGILNGAQEVAGAGPTSVLAPNDSAAVGAGIVTVDTLARTIDVSLTVVGLSLDDLNDGLVASPVGPVHLHNAPVGINGPIAIPFPFGAPLYQSIGTDLGFTVNATGLTEANIILAGLSFDGLLAELNAGNIYFNVHSDAFPGGEIRGQLAPVPLPATGLLLGGMLAFGAYRARKQRRAAA